MSKKNKFISLLVMVLLLVCLLVPNVAMAAPKYSNYKLNKVGYVSAETAVNVRSGPGTKYKVYDSLKRGTKIKYYKYSKKWYLIKYNKKYSFVRAKYVSAKKVSSASSSSVYSPSYFKKMGVLHWGEWRWTWYSQRVLPGGGLKIPGRHVDEKGYVCDENNYICLASSKLKKGTVVNTPLGKKGKVYDSGCASGTLDVYVNW